MSKDEREVTATEAARRFADLLDEVEHYGRRFTIARRGKPVASLLPPLRTTIRARIGRIPVTRQRAKPPAGSSDGGHLGHGDLSDVEAILRPDTERELLLPGLLSELRDLGCVLSVPGGARRDYVGVSAKGKRGRILGIHVSTGRAEFQLDSWDRVGSVDDGFVRLAAGNKAAHPLNSEADLEKILAATRTELRHRGL